LWVVVKTLVTRGFATRDSCFESHPRVIWAH
jgi:hypothetical protein